MTIANGNFAEAGASPGLASGWTSSHVGTAEEFADFAQNPSDDHTLARESHEAGWPAGVDQVTVRELGGETVGTEAAVFNLGPSQQPVENFEMGWSAEPAEGDLPLPPILWMTALSALDIATFNGEDHEDHDWVAFIPTLPTPTDAVFSGNPQERYEVGWATAWIASFNAELSANFTETYEALYVPVVFTVNVDTVTVTVASVPDDPFVDNERVFLQNEGGALPEPLNAGVAYYVSDPSGTSFQLSSVSGGGEIPITSDGEGTHRLTRDPSAWWSRVMATV